MQKTLKFRVWGDFGVSPLRTFVGRWRCHVCLNIYGGTPTAALGGSMVGYCAHCKGQRVLIPADGAHNGES